ncbi:MAG: CaiB/BaiF CoA-transferase family protein [Dehalococcoidia bacterium]|nr:CaiB/BaiF CoA-transferase family protein [Dehalococcoidia bacterium]
MSRLPLEGIRVVEVGQIVAGPTAGLILADMGADVIKVEPPDAGTQRRPGNLRTGSFFFFNRNKRSLVLDMASPGGHEVALRLVRRADVLIENMAPGTMERLRLGYSQVRQENPRLVYCSLKGYLSGPYESRPLMDEPAQMASGLAYMTGPPGRPLRAGASVVDMGAATYAVVGVLAALLQRQSTGQGEHVTGGLFETALFLVGQHMAQAQFSGETPAPMAAVEPDSKRRGFAIYDLFTCKDGRQVFVAVVSDNQWRRLCSVLDMEDLVDDPRLQDNAARVIERNRLLPRIAQAAAARESQELVDILARADVTVAPVHTPLSALEDRHVASERHTLPARIGQVDGRLPTLPYESDAYQFSVQRHAPAEPGQDSREVLVELGYTIEEAEELARRGIVRGPGLPSPPAGTDRTLSTP